YLHGQAELADCVALIKQHSRHFAKRQLTIFAIRCRPIGLIWLRIRKTKMPLLRWCNSGLNNVNANTVVSI
ncbi:tRNA delta(2)-isopentenylpyrophosphate transferase, partial [Lacticaseibacillus paracasei subsp. paracasei Lpp229]